MYSHNRSRTQKYLINDIKIDQHDYNVTSIQKIIWLQNREYIILQILNTKNVILGIPFQMSEIKV